MGMRGQGQGQGRRKKRILIRRKRTVDPNIRIDYRNPDILKRFITDRGKIIPRRISGATARQQREICKAVKQARYLGLIPYSVSHRTERGFTGEMTMINAIGTASLKRQQQRERGGYDRDRGDRQDRGERSERMDRDDDDTEES